MKDEDDTSVPSYHLPSNILCKVVDVELKAFPDSDEVFSVIRLLPDGERGEGSASRSVPHKTPANSFRKMLTISDASTHGGCCLPKADVEKTFPPLCIKDETEDHAFQALVAMDLHGTKWQFQHVYRGCPRRHILANGWNKFASEKKLKAGDTCIFMRGLGENEIYVGVQRATIIPRECTVVTGLDMRHGVLVDASIAMDTKCTFTVFYHPRLCASAFIVPYDKVMEALKVNYLPGMSFEMLVDGGGEDPELKRYTGIVAAKDDIDPARWPHSQWRCLKVLWDVSSFARILPPRVSPWDIQPLSVNVPHMWSSISVDRKRPMSFEPMIHNNPFSRTTASLQSRGLTFSFIDTGSSSRQDETNLDEEQQRMSFSPWTGSSSFSSPSIPQPDLYMLGEQAPNQGSQDKLAI